jgi:phage I-like protein
MNTEISFINRHSEKPLTLEKDGWVQLAPFGDFPGEALMRLPDGRARRFPAIQRMDREAALQMTARFRSPWNRLKRYFTGCPIFVGHPDVPGANNPAASASSKGMIVDLDVRGDGLYCKPFFTDEGLALVEGKKYRAFSGHWTAREIGGTSGNNPSASRIYRPETLKSAGLTNHPNLPVHWLNEKPDQTDPTPITEIMNKNLLTRFLASQGITIANEAADHEIHSALEQLGHRLIEAETGLASRVVEMEHIRAELANERLFHSGALLDEALEKGRITAAQRREWDERFAADFANSAAALAEMTPAIKTLALTAHHSGRRTEVASSVGRRSTLDALVKAEMGANGGDYDAAFAAVQRANPALFDAMAKPSTH